MTAHASNFSLPDSISILNPSVMELLACPACLHRLRLEGRNLNCEQCGRTYPVVDGIPVLIFNGKESPRGY
jgi:uncharacterized protein YbaR (Trm112 family)